MTRGPKISVIVPCYQGAAEIGDCLESLAQQDISSDQFEVVVILNGPDGGMRLRIDTVMRDFPALPIRLLSTSRSGAGHARNLGLQSAAGEYVTFVDHDDWVSPSFLSALLGDVAPGRVAMAPIADVVDDGHPGAWAGVPQYANYIGDVVNAYGGREIPRRFRRACLGFNAAKLVPAAVARAARYDETLVASEDTLYWFDVVSKVNFDVHLTATDSGAAYYRRIRDGSVSRQDPTFEFGVQDRLDTIERLVARHVGDVDKDLTAIRRGLIVGQTSLIRGWVERHLDQTSRVVDEIHRYGLSDEVPWSVLNRGRATELAALFCFTPWLEAGGLAAARRVRERGAIVDLIQVDLSDRAVDDLTSSRIAQEQVARRAVLRVPTDGVRWRGVKSYLRKGLKRAHEWMDEQGPYESLYTRAMPPASHLLGGLLKVDEPTMRWRAEFSEPIAWDADGQARVGRADDDQTYRRFVTALEATGVQPPADRGIHRLAELVAFALADELVFTNEQQLEFMLARLPDPALAERVRERAIV